MRLSGNGWAAWVCVLWLCSGSTGAAQSGAPSPTAEATPSSSEVDVEAVRRERQALRERAETLRQRQSTNDALMEQQDAQLRALERQLEALHKRQQDSRP